MHHGCRRSLADQKLYGVFVNYGNFSDVLCEKIHVRLPLPCGLMLASGTPIKHFSAMPTNQKFYVNDVVVTFR